MAQGLRPEARDVRPVLRQRLRRRVQPADAAGQVRLADRPSDARHHRGDARSRWSATAWSTATIPSCAAPDGLTGDEGTFSLCTFWWVEALTRAGYLREARLTFEKMLTYANPLGLYAEEIGHVGGGARQLPAGVHPPGADQRGLQPGSGARQPAAWSAARMRRRCSARPDAAAQSGTNTPTMAVWPDVTRSCLSRGRSNRR